MFGTKFRFVGLCVTGVVASAVAIHMLAKKNKDNEVTEDSEDKVDSNYNKANDFAFKDYNTYKEVLLKDIDTVKDTVKGVVEKTYDKSTVLWNEWLKKVNSLKTPSDKITVEIKDGTESESTDTSSSVKQTIDWIDDEDEFDDINAKEFVESPWSDEDTTYEDDTEEFFTSVDDISDDKND